MQGGNLSKRIFVGIFASYRHRAADWGGGMKWLWLPNSQADDC